MSTHPFVICLSGFDPCGGAGILADIKTLEMYQVQGLGVCTALTFQNEHSFSGVEWISEETIFRQLSVLLDSYQPKAIKIGIVENLQVLKRIVSYLHDNLADTPLILDPVLRATAGYDFHKKIDSQALNEILLTIDLLTPNLDESEQLFGTTDPKLIAERSACPVLLKGGHADSEFATDLLIENGTTHLFQHEKKSGFSKHGTGCILSAAIAANLALGKSLPDSCRFAKEYMQAILTSNHTKLAYHYEP